MCLIQLSNEKRMVTTTYQSSSVETLSPLSRFLDLVGFKDQVFFDIVCRVIAQELYFEHDTVLKKGLKNGIKEYFVAQILKIYEHQLFSEQDNPIDINGIAYDTITNSFYVPFFITNDRLKYLRVSTKKLSVSNQVYSKHKKTVYINSVESTDLIEGENLWEDKRLKEGEKDLKEQGLSGDFFELVNNEDEPEFMKKANGTLFAGYYRHKKTGIEIIGKQLNHQHYRAAKDLLQKKSKWACPTFFGKTSLVLYEVNLNSFGYISLEKHLKTNDLGLYDRMTIGKAIRQFLVHEKDESFSHSHLHESNIFVKEDSNGNILDIKIIDWKYVTRIKKITISP